ncbi:unnamed protein product [Phytophthora fragariaefolia]|uniref:Unnamed protein product n=1 Tax=Phytophthora fragariaefolia TaxID=1490495 RepID=A0A9W7D746_9STRA|nr:unnamed protein product [Phytophthora fragariaefolia]
MDQSQEVWDNCRQRVARQVELRKQGGREWIIPEVADVMQRQVSAMPSGAAPSNDAAIPLQELLTLLVHAFALSSGAPLEEFTIQMVKKALIESVLQAARTNPVSVEIALPDLFSQLTPYLNAAHSECAASEEEITGGDDWDWNENTNPLTETCDLSSSGIGDFEAKAIVETCVESLVDRLKVVFTTLCN